METPVIELKNISFAAQGTRIVQNVDLSILEGQTVAFAGPSGGGKSTLLKLAAGLIVPSGGEAYYRGQAISRMNRHANLDFRRRMAFVFQDSALWANQSLRQNMELPLKIHYPAMTGKQRTDKIAEACADAGYKRGLDIRPAQLSTGEQKLVAFARAMVCDPDLLFLDEWTESLDDSAAQRLVDLVKRRQQTGATILFVNHDFQVIKELAQRICLVEDGRLSKEIPVKELGHNQELARMIQKGTML